MRFILPKSTRDNVHNLMRRMGYHYQGSSGEDLSFVRPPRAYPRFHIYLREEKDNLAINLHFDQRRPSYKGTAAHGGEYEGEIVENEIIRIKETFKKEYQETI